MSVPESVCWLIQRIVVSKHHNASLIEIQTQWSLDDVMDAWEVIDMLEELEAEAARDPRDQVVG